MVRLELGLGYFDFQSLVQVRLWFELGGQVRQYIGCVESFLGLVWFWDVYMCLLVIFGFILGFLIKIFFKESVQGWKGFQRFFNEDVVVNREKINYLKLYNENRKWG